MLGVLVLVLSLAVAASTQNQHPFVMADETTNDEYHFGSSIRRVAIIGAGPSALVAYRDFTQAGFELRIFERDTVPGGNWHYTEEAPADAPVPNADIPIADFVPSFAPEEVDLPYTEELDGNDDLRRDHRGPKPVWESLKSNAPAPLQQITEIPWPEGTRWELSHYQLRNYVRAFASYHGINSNDDNPVMSYNTRVERVEKRLNEKGQEQGWRLWLKELVPIGENKYRATWWTEDFDAVVVATGRYNAPYMPSIPGLDEWVQRFPGHLIHSRQYRRPEALANKTVLIVGAATSGGEISRDLNTWAHKIYQSIRPDNSTTAHYALINYLRRLPRNTTIVPEIKRFLPLDEDATIQSAGIELVNGTVLTGIDHIIFGTGFRYSFPFLPQYYEDASYVPHEGSSTKVVPFLASNGTHIRDLHLDLFYIRDPTLAFLGMNFGTQAFTYTDYLALALAKVWSNTAKLPSCQQMWHLYQERVVDRGGYGKHFQFLGPDRLRANIRFFMGWLNDAAAKYGGKQIDGLPKYVNEVAAYWAIAHYGGPLENRSDPSVGYSFLDGLGFDIVAPEAMTGEERQKMAYYIMFNDNW
ncbi:hypothetical protein SERLA73DRAFT_174607 [Serpula lacrymans var. lacrymans S7.3]|uniref:FAD/NAD(P)-binding domain-containing protein n=2 Tax=Serpula lacrymans var. lacrymans TaxID=341189 RepID=F8PIZ9_SERL3|nr:uncharacterized protein SERLADRAFT_456213 [Serpula lacrymans var. lacrymans S7.9]EGO03160.1 hypothetical protein SERLA73DRAFT_174607 [Serpula lacrymans var. lacrymans S7.3]EGO28942.1 hypothetical protein SERLADRAFT_456213 [Serpula lacrymans var. lacrymans S7.9]